MSISSDLVDVHVTEEGYKGREPGDRLRKGCLELIESWLWVGEVPEISFDCLVMTSIDQGDAGVILFTNERVLVCHVEKQTGNAWQQTANRAKATRIQRRRKVVGNHWNVYEAGIAIPGTNAVAVSSSSCTEFEAALTKDVAIN